MRDTSVGHKSLALLRIVKAATSNQVWMIITGKEISGNEPRATLALDHEILHRQSFVPIV